MLCQCPQIYIIKVKISVPENVHYVHRKAKLITVPLITTEPKKYQQPLYKRDQLQNEGLYVFKKHVYIQDLSTTVLGNLVNSLESYDNPLKSQKRTGDNVHEQHRILWNFPQSSLLWAKHNAIWVRVFAQVQGL